MESWHPAMDRIEEHLSEGNVREALSLMRQHEEHLPSLLRARVLYRANDADAALRLLSPDTELDHDATLLRAQCLTRLRRFSEARDLLVRAVAEEPTSDLFWVGLGCCCEELGDYEEQARCFRKAVAIRPEHAAWHYNLGNALFDLDRIDEAIQEYERAEALGLSDPFSLYHNLALAYECLQVFSGAIDSVEQALSIRPRDLGAKRTLIRVLVKSGNRKLLRRQLLREPPKQADYLRRYAREVRKEQGRSAASRERRRKRFDLPSDESPH